MFNRTRLAAATLALLALAAAAAAGPAPDLVVADFEADAYAPGWTTTGTAFGPGPARGGFADQQPVAGFRGRGLVDSYRGGDAPVGTLTSPSFTVERAYVNLLVGGGGHAGQTCVNLVGDGGHVLRTATGADDERLDPVTWDVRPLRGRRVVIQIVDRARGSWGHVNVDHIVQSDTPAVTDAPVYAERYRPQFHFTARRGWLNDPNGLVFADGEYHLFFQHNPDQTTGGANMSWGHAVSPDLTHWTELPIALAPDAHDGYIWSGSAVVDGDNTSRLGTPGRPPLVAMYTAAKAPFAQAIASSTDRGRTWTKYPGNPVIGHVARDNRDPHLVWHGPTKRWVVVFFKDVNDTFCLYDSPDLIHWTPLQEFRVAGCGECPDFFPIKVDGGGGGETKWVFTAANGKYVVGTFDGHAFRPEQDVRQVDYGGNFYAVQTYADAPSGRRIQVAWMRGGRYPRMPFNQQMSYPAELTLRGTPDGPRLFRWPVAELDALHGKATRVNDVDVTGESAVTGVSGNLFDIALDVDVGTATEVGLSVRGEPVVYSVRDQVLHALGTAPLALTDGRLRLRVLVDRTSVETFAEGGRVSLTSCCLPKGEGVTVVARGGTAHVRSVVVTELKSAWAGG